jgi:altronate hydrolase
MSTMATQGVAETASGSAASVIRLSALDDVVTAAQPIPAGSVVDGGGDGDSFDVVVATDVPQAHKIAVRDLPAGSPVRKYGEIIGVTTMPVAAGEHVHTHNLAFDPGSRDHEMATGRRDLIPVPVAERRTFRGYRRSDGKVGTRNYLGVLCSVNCSATAARRIAENFRHSGFAEQFPNVDGVVALTHRTGCGMAGIEPIASLRRTLAGYLTHPNFAGILVLGLGCEDNQISALTRDVPVRPDLQLVTGTIQELGGTAKTVAAGLDILRGMLPAANAVERTDISVSELVLGTNCGGSDGFSGLTANPALGFAVDELIRQGGTGVLAETPEIYGAEHLLTRRAATPEVGARLMDLVHWWERHAEAGGATLDANPSPGNKAGGLTTILEKSLGAIAKAGTGTLHDVVEYGAPITTHGLVFMDTPGFDPVSVTGLVAGGANLVCFTTGRGSALGTAPVPTLKIATNTTLFERQGDDMDVNAGVIVDGGKTVAEVGAEIFERLLAVASGEKTHSEEWGYGEEEFVPWQVGITV